MYVLQHLAEILARMSAVLQKERDMESHLIW